MIVKGRGIVGKVRPRTHSIRPYPLGFCPACVKIQEAGYCTHCGSSVDPLDKSIRWPPAKSWGITEADVKGDG